MGQKVNPIGFRVGYTKDWRSRWFASNKEFAGKLIEDAKIRETINKNYKEFSISRVNIERFANRVRVVIHTSRPGLVIGNKGSQLEEIKKQLVKHANGKDLFVDVVEIRDPEADATLVAQNIAAQLERRIAFRRAMKKSIQAAMDKGVDGISIKCGGRLGGADLARNEKYREGRVPLQTISANIDYGFAEADTTMGKIGIKVWICKPQNWEQNNGTNAKKGKVQKGSKRKPRR